jgi:hypothetical protein
MLWVMDDLRVAVLAIAIPVIVFVVNMAFVILGDVVNLWMLNALAVPVVTACSRHPTIGWVLFC